MANIKENETANGLRYLPISSGKIKEALKGKSEEQLKELGVSEGVLFMISMGYVNQLREDVYEILFQALNIDISPNNSHKNNESSEQSY